MKLKTLAMLSMTVAMTSQAYAGNVDQSQRMLNQLGYNAGAVDGAYGKKTRSALEKFYADNGSSYDGKLDANEVADLTAAMDAAGIKSAPFNHSLWTAEKKWNETVGPEWSSHLRKLYNSNFPANYISADMNNDGIIDFVYSSVFKVENVRGSGKVSMTEQNDAEHGQCIDQVCRGENAHPTIYFGRSDGSYIKGTGAVIDNRKVPGYRAGMVNVADFNGDGKPDMYINDTMDDQGSGPNGVKEWNGRHDSFYLSQPNGTWVESSDTHLSHSKFKVFNHGYTIGDIDNDNDIDIVMTTNFGSLYCWVNQGAGHMKLNKNCGRGIKAFSLELGDMDGDGDLDIISSHMEERGLGWNPGETAIHYNNGKGSFRKNSVRLKEYTGKYDWNFTISQKAVDLDNDGDMDIIMSRQRSPYVGLAYEVTENLGNGKFKNHGLNIRFDIPNYSKSKHKKIVSEANNLNETQYIRLSDFNNVGLMDYISFRGKGRFTNSVYINNGDFTFTEFGKNDKNNPARKVTAGSFNQKNRFYMKDMY